MEDRYAEVGLRDADIALRYAEVARTFGAAIERLAGGYERDPDARRDLMQEIHVALWRSLARFDGRCSLRTWVYRVAHNTAISRVVRPRASAPTLVAIDESLDAAADAVDREAGVDRRRALDRLYALVRRLRPLDRQVMLLYLEEEDAASIAEITGLSVANVSTKIHRIKQILVRQFHEGSGHGE
jgi:RNA polymerase sigma-70 factor (ECF subfamily)